VYAMKKADVKGIVTKEHLKFKYSVDVTNRTNSFKKDFIDCYKEV
jgi:hypothetical protein